MDKLKKFRNDYLNYLKNIRGYSSLTSLTYSIVLKEALDYIEIFYENEIINLNLLPYRMKIKKQSKKTVAKKISILNGYTKYLQKYKNIKLKLLNNDTIKVPKTLPKPVSHENIIKVLAESTLEQKIIILMFYSLGVRISELTHVKLDDIKSRWIRVTGKGSKQRDIPVIDKLGTIIKEYLKTANNSIYLFERKDGEPYSSMMIGLRVRKAFNKVGLNITPHQLRHSYATELLNGGARIVDVSELLGHASLSTTQIYTKVSSDLKMKEYKKAHPIFRDNI